jgi:hypothetical protein
VATVDVASEAIKVCVVAVTMEVRSCVINIIIGIASPSQSHRVRSFHGPRVMRDDLKRVLEDPHGAYHAHLRALAAHSNPKKSYTHTSEKFLKNPIASCFVSFPLGSITKT